eukprot:scaffold123993_cov33-Prasinocladus_malaysianus.AAC.1
MVQDARRYRQLCRYRILTNTLPKHDEITSHFVFDSYVDTWTRHTDRSENPGNLHRNSARSDRQNATPEFEFLSGLAVEIPSNLNSWRPATIGFWANPPALLTVDSRKRAPSRHRRRTPPGDQ